MLPNISIVIPVYNEKENLTDLFKELETVLKENYSSFEIIFVDDGSNDGSNDVLEKLSKANSFVKLIEFRKNFGQSEAIQAGLDYSEGELIAMMDADMQNDPADIPELMEKLVEQDLDMVNGWRKNREDSLGKKISSAIASPLRRRLFDTDLHDYGCTLRVIKRKPAERLNLNGEMHRYIPPLLELEGFDISEVEVNHRPRNKGETKYGLSRLPKGFVDMLKVLFWKRFAERPLHIFGILGLTSIFFGLNLAIVAVYQKLNGTSLSDTAATTLSVFMILIGMQFFISGILADIGLKNGKIKPENPKYHVCRTVK